MHIFIKYARIKTQWVRNCTYESNFNKTSLMKIVFPKTKTLSHLGFSIAIFGKEFFSLWNC